MGYPSLQEGYRVFEPSIGDFFVNKDVIFHMNMFPFHNEASSSRRLDTTTTFRRFLFEEDSSRDKPYVIMSPQQHPTSIPASDPTIDDVHASTSILEHSIEDSIIPIEENSNLSSNGSPSTTTIVD